MSVISRVDAYQRRHRWAGLPLAVVYMFFDDQGNYLTAQIAYYGFVSLFPLLLLLVTILGYALGEILLRICRGTWRFQPILCTAQDGLPDPHRPADLSHAVRFACSAAIATRLRHEPAVTRRTRPRAAS